MNTEEDSKLLAEAAASKLEEDKINEVVQKPLPRKPLPENAKSSMDIYRKPMEAPDSMSSSNPNNKITRKPLAQDQLNILPPDSDRTEGTQRRPFGPRPIMSEAFISTKPAFIVDGRPSSSGTQMHCSTDPDSANVTNPNETFPATRTSKKAFSVTIIRRDLSSAAQWNVGSFIGEEESENILRTVHSKKPYYNILVNITTPGYGQFRDLPANAKSAGRMTSPYPPGNPQTGFDRRIRMEGSSFWDRSKQHKRAQSDIPDAHNTTRGQRGSIDSLNTSFLNPQSNGGHESHTKGYSFRSPWGGHCKFSTSGSGRTLRCNHTLPGPVSASNTTDEGSPSQVAVAVSELRFNLPSSAIFQSSIPPNSATKGRGTEPGRFHIPKFDQIRNKLSPEKSNPPLPPRPHSQLRPPPGSYAALYPSDDEDLPALPPRPHSHAISSDDDREHSRHSVVSNPFQHRSMWTSEEDDEGHLDLSLGQEKAGGGNRGKRVKLGKLIVFDEGCKMIDLIVAANMGIWWSIWESNV